MPDVYVVGALCTPFGSFGGALVDIEAPQLVGTVVKAMVDRVGLGPAAVDGVLVGQVLSGGKGQAPARQAVRYGCLRMAPMP